MDLQTSVTLVMVGLAGAYLFRRGFQAWRASRGKGCPGDCGCADASPSTAPGIIPADQLVLRSRPPSADHSK